MYVLDKIKKSRYTLQTPVLLYNSGVHGGILFMDMFSDVRILQFYSSCVSLEIFACYISLFIYFQIISDFGKVVLKLTSNLCSEQSSEK